MVRGEMAGMGSQEAMAVRQSMVPVVTEATGFQDGARVVTEDLRLMELAVTVVHHMGQVALAALQETRAVTFFNLKFFNLKYWSKRWVNY